jgi:hypothetical protein
LKEQKIDDELYMKKLEQHLNIEGNHDWPGKEIRNTQEARYD